MRRLVGSISSLLIAAFFAFGCQETTSTGPKFEPLEVAASALPLPEQQLLEQPPVFVKKWGSFGTGKGEFDRPAAIAVDALGNVYVVDGRDGNNHRIQKFDADGNFLLKWGTFGSGQGEFQYPRGIGVDGAGNVYVVDLAECGRVQKFDSDGTFGTAWGGCGRSEGSLGSPLHIAVDDQGTSYVVEQSNSRISKFASDGSFLRMWGWGVRDGSSEFQICISDCGPGINGSGEGQFQDPWGVAADRAGNVFVSDFEGGRIQKFDSDGNLLTAWSEFGRELPAPRGVAVDHVGNVYVSVAGQWVDKFDGTGTFLTTWGGSGSGDGQFRNHDDLAVDARGNIYVADTENHRIQKFAPAVESVQIDIKPGSDPNCFNNDGHGVIPVAILGSANFDAGQVDPSTVQLKGMAVKAVGKSGKLLAHLDDVNGDGVQDLVVQIQDDDGAFQPGTGTATLTGTLFDGTPIEGSDEICIVP